MVNRREESEGGGWKGGRSRGEEESGGNEVHPQKKTGDQGPSSFNLTCNMRPDMSYFSAKIAIFLKLNSWDFYV